MEIAFLAVGCVILGVFLARLGFRLGDDGALVALINGFRALGPRDWPIGVQEEDRDRPWSKNLPPRPPKAPPEPELRVTLQRVRSVIHTR